MLTFKSFAYQLLHEFFGSFFFAIWVGVARDLYLLNGDYTYDWLYFLLYFLVWMNYVLAYGVSGGHLNGALTFFAWARKGGQMYWYQWLLYIIAQLLGMGSGVWLNWWYLNTTPRLNIYQHYTGQYWYAEAFGQEIASGAILTIVFLIQTDPITWISNNKLWQTAAISFTVKQWIKSILSKSIQEFMKWVTQNYIFLS